jgi:hypothetical protein
MDWLEEGPGADAAGVRRFKGGWRDVFWEGETWIRAELAGVVCCVAAHEDELGVRCTGEAADVVMRCSSLVFDLIVSV